MKALFTRLHAKPETPKQVETKINKTVIFYFYSFEMASTVDNGISQTLIR